MTNTNESSESLPNPSSGSGPSLIDRAMSQTEDQQLKKALRESYRITQASRLILEEDLRAGLDQNRQSVAYVHSQENRALDAMTSRAIGESSNLEADTMPDEDDKGISLGDSFTETHHHHPPSTPPPQKSNLLPLALTAILAAGSGGAMVSIPTILDSFKQPPPVVAPEDPGEDADTKYEFRISSGDPKTKE